MTQLMSIQVINQVKSVKNSINFVESSSDYDRFKFKILLTKKIATIA